MSTDIKAVIFDWGGVLIEDPAPGLMRYCAAALGVSVGDFQQAHARCGGAFQTGRISEPRFWQQVCAALSVPEPTRESLWGWAFRQIYQPRTRVLEAISGLQRTGTATALLSNTEMPVVAYFEELQYSMFDVAVFSCMEGVCKPQAEIYQSVVERLGVSLQQCLFLDDREVFVSGAQILGMQAFQCVSEYQVLKVLQKIFGFELPVNNCG